MTNMIIAVAVTVFLLASRPASAQPRAPIQWDAYSVMVGGHVADLWTTHRAFQRGAVEGNGILRGRPTAALVVSKSAFVVGLTYGMRALERHGHPRWARVVGYLNGSVVIVIAAHNAGVARE